MYDDMCEASAAAAVPATALGSSDVAAIVSATSLRRRLSSSSAMLRFRTRSISLPDVIAGYLRNGPCRTQSLLGRLQYARL
ncbi:uncharacterized protein SPSK_04746 [Sporothrix schenckii 1099-18]|uniref:Uncharacterized protein n=1 Tax=Sporothrix schenckii 1099-18 TaxID=1397361 RepID=A0A0F2LZH5_SPOSC|nr:uncharacterized protein SPSK_04746 [Sporothrix schenckii 1099-18]KJR82867.1 hypothetical protein SPSK_04746 [Sporothrix schenckii 1099-18]